uniref:Malectin-like domain-containing protein n=1 Tax=Fagus sylvatica TaxID=28930 RepID=A0A2N9EIB0_FAGSY
MDGAPESALLLKAWLPFVLAIVILGNSRLAAGNNHYAGRKLNDEIPGFISIDCGATSDYLDEGTGLFYKSDTGFIDTGTNNYTSPECNSSNPDYGRLITNLRSFPNGTKNCYTLKPEQGKNKNYLIRAFFCYGNYDNKNEIPKFDVYVGVNYWATVEPSSVSNVVFPDIIHVPSSDTIFVCLINTGFGIPFISALELRPLEKSLYSIDMGALRFGWRYDMGTSRDKVFVRYKNDVYDRFWYTVNKFSNWVPINSSSSIDLQGNNNSYKPPTQVLRTAVQPPSYDQALRYEANNTDEFSKCYVCFHFAEIAKLAQGKKREFIIAVNGRNYTSKPITLDRSEPLSMCLNQIFEGHFSFSINATTGSDLPPILNAFEVYRVFSPLYKPTYTGDVAAIMDIKQTNRISRDDWQGDPCAPQKFSWSGLTCNSDDTPRITSLNLSSSKLTGEIATSLSNLTALQYLLERGDTIQDMWLEDIWVLIPKFHSWEVLSVSKDRNIAAVSLAKLGSKFSQTTVWLEVMKIS